MTNADNLPTNCAICGSDDLEIREADFGYRGRDHSIACIECEARTVAIDGKVMEWSTGRAVRRMRAAMNSVRTVFDD